MRILSLNLILIACLTVVKSNAQDLTAKWSKQQLFTNETGMFRSLAGENTTYIYFIYGSLNPLRPYKQVKLVALDKTTMKQEAEYRIHGFPDTKSKDSKYKDLSYYKTLTFKDVIYVFWTQSVSGNEELYVQSFDIKLKPLNSLKQIYVLKSIKGQVKDPALFVMGNPDFDERIIIGGELASKKDEPVKMEYKLLNKDFSFSFANQVKLPVTVTGKSYALSSNYEFGDRGDLYVTTVVRKSKEDIKKAPKGEATRYPILSIIKLTTGKIVSYPIKFENKNIFNFSYVQTKMGTKLFGFFSDLKKDPKGDDMHGIFSLIMDINTMSPENINFSYFTKDVLLKLFAGDPDTKKKSAKQKTKEAGNLNDDYVIEQVQSIDENNMVLFCSLMGNYSSTTCNSKGQCTTKYWCVKKDVTVFKINNKGEIVWASHLDRQATYRNNWNVYDVNVIYKDNKFYTIYGSDFQILTNKKSSKSKKSGDQKLDRLEYAVFDYKTGDYTKKEMQINSLGVKKADKKFILASSVSVLDDRFFVASINTRYKPTLALGCLASVACFPLIYPTFMSNWFKKYTGYFGFIYP